MGKHKVWQQGTAWELYGPTSRHRQRPCLTIGVDARAGQSQSLPSKSKSLHSLTHMYLPLLWFHASILILLNYPQQM